MPILRRPLLSILFAVALLGQALHVLRHHPVEVCPDHIAGAHFGVFVKPAPDCPFCLLAGIAAPGFFSAALLFLLEILAVPGPARLCARPALALRTRAPPR